MPGKPYIVVCPAGCADPRPHYHFAHFIGYWARLDEAEQAEIRRRAEIDEISFADAARGETK